MSGTSRVISITTDFFMVRFVGMEGIQKTTGDVGSLVDEPRRFGLRDCATLRQILDEKIEKTRKVSSILRCRNI